MLIVYADDFPVGVRASLGLATRLLGRTRPDARVAEVLTERVSANEKHILPPLRFHYSIRDFSWTKTFLKLLEIELYLPNTVNILNITRNNVKFQT